VGSDDPNNTIRPVTTDRGFTNHEHLDTLGLIHMNARVYDPAIGRFMSPDPIIQDPYDLQSYNRYSYVRNNPLLYLDPSGHNFFSSLGHSISHAWKSVWNSTVGRIAITVAVAYFTGYYDWGTSALGSGTSYVGVFGTAGVGNSVAAGFAGSFVGSGGNVQAGLQGALTGAMFYGVGSAFPYGSDPVMNVVGHAVVGCASASMSHGNCSSGAISAGFADIASNNMPGFIKGDQALELTYVSVVGGTASVLGGGKFANGAETAAFGYLFNDVSHWKQEERASAQVMRDFGYRVEEGVKLLIRNANGELITVIADSIGVKDGLVVITEVKDGLGAKLSPGQKALFSEAARTGSVMIAAEDRAAALGLKAGVMMIDQAGTVTRLAIRLDGTLVGRAAGQAIRAAGTDGVASMVRVIGSASFFVATELLLHMGAAQ
jgi:RHS repeat-associated protein